STSHDCQLLNRHDSHTHSNRSRGCNRGRDAVRDKMASCCRNARFSAASVARLNSSARHSIPSIASQVIHHPRTSSANGPSLPRLQYTLGGEDRQDTPPHYSPHSPLSALPIHARSRRLSTTFTIFASPLSRFTPPVRLRRNASDSGAPVPMRPPYAPF